MATGELIFNKNLWIERKHLCVICGVYLPVFHPIHFSHTLAKGPYPRFRLNSENIEIFCSFCHYTWEFERNKIKDDPKWKWLFDKQIELKCEYYDVI